MEYMNRFHNFLIEIKVDSVDVIIGYPKTAIFYKGLLTMTFIGIISWVIMNKGHITIDDKFLSTLNLKMTGGFQTNFTDDDFNIYVTPQERINYNRQWDYTDYGFEFPNQIQIMTNVVITPNQTQTVCPEHPASHRLYAIPKTIIVVLVSGNCTGL
jgi:hypothetical protein